MSNNALDFEPDVQTKSFTELNFFDCLDEASIEDLDYRFGTSNMHDMHEGDVYFEPEEEQEVRYSDETILSEFLRSAAAEEPRKRFVRFFDEPEVSSDQSVKMGGLLAGGLLAGGMGGCHTFGEGSDTALGTLDIFDDEGSPSRNIDPGSSDSNIVAGEVAAGMVGESAFEEGSDDSFGILDVFHDEGSPSTTIDPGSSNSKITTSDDETDEDSVDSEAEKEKEIRKSIMYAFFGAGAIGFAAFGFKKVMNMMNHDRDQDAGGSGDMVSDAADTTTHLSDASSTKSSEAIAQASLNASAQQSDPFLACAFGANPTAMTGAQYV